MSTRKRWHRYFMDIAEKVATRATCDRKHVGAVIVSDKTILSTGYNGSIRGAPHCDDVGHMMEDGHCIRTVHAEVNAVAQAARNGVRVDGATVYVTLLPCWSCFKTIANAGIKKVIFSEIYGTEKEFQRLALAAKATNIEILHLLEETANATVADFVSIHTYDIVDYRYSRDSDEVEENN